MPKQPIAVKLTSTPHQIGLVNQFGGQHHIRIEDSPTRFELVLQKQVLILELIHN